jgi:SPP1 family predicted phage head-tail adaptor
MKGVPTIGAMRHFVEIQQAMEARDSDGSVTTTWEAYANEYAEIVPLSGSEDYIAQGISASVVYRISMRYVAGVVPKMRIAWNDRTFEIHTVRSLDERDRWLVMNCQEYDV